MCSWEAVVRCKRKKILNSHQRSVYWALSEKQWFLVYLNMDIKGYNQMFYQSIFNLTFRYPCMAEGHHVTKILGWGSGFSS